MTTSAVHQKRVAVVTGASSGIGRELARQAAQHGYDVVLVARRTERLEALAAELRVLGAGAQPVVADLSEAAGVQRVVDAVAGTRVDVLVNDAGVGGHGAFAVDRDLAADLAMIRLNIIALVARMTPTTARASVLVCGGPQPLGSLAARGEPGIGDLKNEE